jgi:hypothetical protein
MGNNWENMTFENAAAWVQAVGSVFAIFVAVGIAWAQKERENRAKVAEKRDQVNERINRIHHLVRALHESVCTQFEWAQTGEFHEASIHAIDHEVELLERIPIVEIPAESLSSYRWFIRNAQRQSARLRNLSEQNFDERNVEEYSNEIHWGIHDTNLGRDLIYSDLGIPNPQGKPIYTKPYKYE